MRIPALIFGLLLSAALAAAQSPVNVTFAWSANPLNLTTGWPVCDFASSPKIGCMEGYTLTDTTVLSAPTAIIQTCTASTQANCLNATATSWTVPMMAETPGPHTFTLVAEGVNGLGALTPSAPVTATVVIPAAAPNPPVGFTVTP